MENINLIEKTYRKLVASGRPPLKLFSGNPNEHGFYFPSEPLIKSYSNYFKNQTYQPHPKGLLKAREAICQFYLERGIKLDPGHILLTSGTSESFFCLFSLLARPGDNILVPNPAYPLFEYIARLAHVELRHYPLLEKSHWDLDLDQIQALMDKQTRALLLVSPNNPTGAVTSMESLISVTGFVNREGMALICDEVFSEFFFGTESFPRAMKLAKPELCFTLNGISKMFALPALKLGWIAATGNEHKVKEAIDGLETISDTFLSTHTPIQMALPEIFLEGRDFLQSYQEEVRRRRDLAIGLLQNCSELSFALPQGGFYLMARVLNPSTLSEEEWVLKLMEEKGIFVHPGYFFDYEDGIHFVISFLTTPQKLERGVKAIGQFLKS